jgi:hypothetical protein
MIAPQAIFEGTVKTIRQVPQVGEKKPYSAIIVDGDLRPGNKYCAQVEYREFRDPKCKAGDRVQVTGEVRVEGYEHDGKVRGKLIMTFGQVQVLGQTTKQAQPEPDGHTKQAAEYPKPATVEPDDNVPF